MRKLKFPLALLCAFAAICLCAGAARAVGNPFEDVSEYDDYYDAVMWAYANDVTSGVTADTFAPKATCNRGQVVTFLWRASGRPEPKTASNPFTDVRQDSYCYKAVLWAVENGITNGTSATTFSPTNPCTYAHVVTFLWRANGQPSEPTSDNAWYAEAVSWANERGLLAGYSFNPAAPCPRACIVIYLYRNETGLSESAWEMLEKLAAADVFEKTLEEAIEGEWDEEWLFNYFAGESEEETAMSDIIDAEILETTFAGAFAEGWAEDWLDMYYHAFTDALSVDGLSGRWFDEGIDWDEDEPRHVSSLWVVQKGSACAFRVYYRGGHSYVFRGNLENGVADCMGIYIHRGELEETEIESQFRVEGKSLLWISESDEEMRYYRAE